MRYSHKEVSIGIKTIFFLMGITAFLTDIFGQVEWEKCTTVPVKADLMGVIYHESTYLVVGDSGTILTSTDGNSWTKRTSGTNVLLVHVVWGNSQYIVVGDSGTILSSPDGETWIKQNSGTTNKLNGIVWNGSQYITAGDAGTILTSPDGETWTIQTSGTTEILDDIVWARDTYVVVGNLGTIISSPDGVTWTAQNANSDYFFRGIVWDGTKFLCVGQEEEGSGDPVIVDTSADGVTWTPLEINNGTYADWLFGLLWDGEQFIAVGFFGTIITSTNGVSWEDRTFFLMKNLEDVAKGSDLYIAVGGGGSILTSSTVTRSRQHLQSLQRSSRSIVVSNNSITYVLASANPVTIRFYTVAGQRIQTIYCNRQAPGVYNMHLPSNLAHGRYLLSFNTGNRKRIVIPFVKQ